MNALENLHGRVSIPAKFLTEPAPTGDDRAAIFQAAVTAPDHAAMRPWRFIVVEGEARTALGEVFARAALARDPDMAEDQVERQRQKPLRSPLLVVVVATIQPDHPKVPEFEQLLSAGVAAQHMQLAARALGYGSVWVTGPNATDAMVCDALGLQQHDRIVGFVHFGTSSIETPNMKRPDPNQFVQHWTGAD